MDNLVRNLGVLDIVLGVVLVGGAAWGMSRGLVREVISIVGFIAALLLANQYHPGIAAALRGILGPLISALKTPLVADVIAFALIVLVVVVVTHVVAAVLNRIAGLLFFGCVNTMGGMLLGVAESALFLTVSLLILTVLSPTTASEVSSRSAIARELLPYTPLLFSSLPPDLIPTSELPRLL